MRTFPFVLFDAFSDVPFGGSQAAVVSNASDISNAEREKIAGEMGMPATAFVEGVDQNTVTAQFFSTVMELPMCGHGTICLMTWLVETGALQWDDDGEIDIELLIPAGPAVVEARRRPDGRPLVMLEIAPPQFRNDSVDRKRLADLLSVAETDFDSNLPMETACGDFVHLIVPLKSLNAMRRIKPDFPGLIALCHEHAIETVATFSTQVEQAGNTLHVRDFCPAAGVWESSSAGTTNGALASYLIRHERVRENSDGPIVVLAEQGLEIDRASSIQSVARMEDGAIARLQVGGVATKIIEGQLQLPDHDKPAGD